MENRTGLTDMRELLKSAAYMCESYADFIKREVKAADIEQHPYLPELEGVAEDIRETLAVLASRDAAILSQNLALRVAADALNHGAVAMGSDGEWVSVRRHVRDAAVAAMRAAALALLQAPQRTNHG